MYANRCSNAALSVPFDRDISHGLRATLQRNSKIATVCNSTKHMLPDAREDSPGFARTCCNFFLSTQEQRNNNNTRMSPKTNTNRHPVRGSYAPLFSRDLYVAHVRFQHSQPTRDSSESRLTRTYSECKSESWNPWKRI